MSTFLGRVTVFLQKLLRGSVQESLKQRAARGSREKFDTVLAKAADREPEDADRL